MAISIVILIPGVDPGERTVAFGASENSRPIGYSPVSVEMRD